MRVQQESAEHSDSDTHTAHGDSAFGSPEWCSQVMGPRHWAITPLQAAASSDKTGVHVSQGRWVIAVSLESVPATATDVQALLS